MLGLTCLNRVRFCGSTCGTSSVTTCRNTVLWPWALLIAFNTKGRTRMRYERNNAHSQQTALGTKRRLLIAATFLLLTGSVAFADDEAVQRGVIAATAAWAEAFNARDAQRIAAFYAYDAVFWGKISPTIRTTPRDVLEYFTNST